MPVVAVHRALFLAGFVAACGGKTSGVKANGPPDAGGTGGGAGSEAGTPDSAGSDAEVGHDGSSCVTVDTATLDQSCVTDSDCTPVYAGQVCDGICFGCTYNTAINTSAVATYQSDVASIPQGTCGPCAYPGSAICAAGKCALCRSPTGCADAGMTEPADSGPPLPDGSACVEVSPSSFSRACSTDGDCTLVTTGLLCSGSCACGDTPISTASLASYEAAVSSIMFAGCPCAVDALAQCVAGSCTACSFGPNQPPGCGDGG